jgi:YjbR
MTRDHVLDVCASLPGAVEDYPFGDDVAVFKVGGRVFALIMLEGTPGPAPRPRVGCRGRLLWGGGYAAGTGRAAIGRVPVMPAACCYRDP